MIDPIRLRNINNEKTHHQMKKVPRCITCHREDGVKEQAVYLCLECKMKCYCEKHDRLYHVGKKTSHKRKRIVIGRPFEAKTTMTGDNFTFPKTFQWVTLHYKMHVKHKVELNQVDVSLNSGRSKRLFNFLRKHIKFGHVNKHGLLVDSTYSRVHASLHFPFLSFYRARPIQFQAGCSGPCMHVQILNCSNLHAADSNGFSDPYVAVWWKDTLIGTTRVLRKTTNPEWANETFVVPLEQGFTDIFGKKEVSSVIQNKIKGEVRQTIMATSTTGLLLTLVNSIYRAGAGADSSHHNFSGVPYHSSQSISPLESQMIVQELNGENVLGVLPKIRIDVFDYDRFSKNDFLGQKTFSDNEILQILFENEIKSCRTFPMEPKKARGVLGIKLGRTETDKLSLQITDGKNLPKADPFNLSDPYCTVYWNGEQVGKKTKTIKETLDPIWNHCYYDVVLGSGSEEKEIDEGVLVIRVWDWDRVGSDDELGMLEFKGGALKELIDKSEKTANLGVDDNVLRVIEEQVSKMEMGMGIGIGIGMGVWNWNGGVEWGCGMGGCVSRGF